jgi:hypothetical protein
MPDSQANDQRPWHTGPRQPSHVREPCSHVNVGFVMDLLLQDKELHGLSFRADGRLADSDAIAIDIHSLFRKTDEDHHRSGR